MLDIIEVWVYFVGMNKSYVIFSLQMPLRSAFPKETVLLYDSILDQKPFFKNWSQKFTARIPLKSGEKLKTLSSLEVILKKIAQFELPQTTQMTFLAVGGGSVGDFTGLLASLYLRGRDLIHIPSTWLAAIDSAHGGKNGLNFENKKNQLGTFYFAQKIYIVQNLLKSQPAPRLTEALGEALKISLINDSASFYFIEKNSLSFTTDQFLKILPRLIQDKEKIVQLDPFEKKGLRRVLNLGHTMGHVLESYYGWPHGICVLLGILFSVRWSYHLKLIDEKNYIRISNLIEDIYPQAHLSADLKGLPSKILNSCLLKDKKMTAQAELDFIFIIRIGKVLRQKVKVANILKEVHRQTKEY